MSRILIVNADDANLTSGVTRSILQCHDQGIVTSTTFLINLPIDPFEIKQIKKRKKLGVGLHLNITLGDPVSKRGQVGSLVDAHNRFQRSFGKKWETKQVVLEYENQIKLFKKVFGRKPSHLDTHHQLHDQKDFFKILVSLAKKHRLPIRRSNFRGVRYSGVRTTDFLLNDLDPKHHWKRKKLEQAILQTPEGVTEVMCHPGVNDSDLKKISSFQQGRSIEWRIFRCPGLRRWVKKRGIQLDSFHVL